MVTLRQRIAWSTIACVLCLGAVACEIDAPTVSSAVSQPGLLTASRVDADAPPSPCSPCDVGPITLVRETGTPRSDIITFPAARGKPYIIDLDDLGTQGAEATVELNGATLLAPHATGDGSAQHVTDTLQLEDLNTLVVRLEGKPGSALRVAIWQVTPPGPPFVATGIKDIRAFLDLCPTADPAYGRIRQDFELRVDGSVITADITCTGQYSALPIDQLTDEIIALQVLRTAFYMSMGTEGRLPWTQKALYDWMASNIAGVNIKTAPGQLYCCDVINGKLYFSTSRQDAVQRGFKRDWLGIAISLDFFAHEIRHADPGAPGHVTGCQAFPLPTDTRGCDQTYDLNNLGSFGVQYWLESNWATGFLNIGIGCAPPDIAVAYVQWNELSANLFRSRFVENIPPVVTATPPFGGPCLAGTARLP